MNYQRILSYLYDYDRGVKRKNIGFVKVETRGDLCRVNLHMKLPEYRPPETLRVYFFFRRNDEILGIPFADAKPVGSECDVRAMLPVSFFDSCGYAPDEFAGIYICQDDRRDLVFVSAWDDEPVYVETFRELRQPVSSEETAQPAEEDSIAETAQSAEEDSSGKTSQSAEGDPIAETAQPAEEDSITETSQSAEEDSSGKTSQSAETVSSVELPQQETLNSLSASSVSAATSGNSADPLPTSVFVYGEEEQACPAPARSQWEELAKNFTKFPVNDGDTVVECLKIRPHHLALLPRRYWNDSNSSFLLRGYYTCGHIILARREPGGECFLGIPGKNCDRDRVMAGYYGYTKYLPTGRKNHGCGYWCKQIEL